MISIEKIVDVPRDIELTIDGERITVRGPKGELERDFSHASVGISQEGDKIIVSKQWPRRRGVAVVGTV